MKTLLSAFLCLIILNVFGQLKPFPQHTTYAAGSIKPSTYTQAQMDQHIKSFYDTWKADYFHTACVAGQYYVNFTDGSIASTSEGHGYGMMIAAIMAGYDTQAKTIFDGLYAYYKGHPSGLTQGLMAWQQNTSCVNINGADAATDGDVDIAYALLLADKQWGSNGSINYLQEAKTMINGIKSGELNGSIIKLGDWYDNNEATYGNSTRPSDFILDHYRAFKKATSDATWDNVITKAYSIFSTIQTNNSPNTGLVPDFVVDCNTTPVPADPDFLEGANDGNYDFNACRVPWRIGTDFLMSGETKAKTALDKINTWIKTKTGGNASNVSPGYTLSGTALVSGWDSPAFTGPFGVSAMCNSANQAWVNSIYNYLNTYDTGIQGYYENSIAMMCLIVMSGNYWAPEAGTTPTYTLTTTATNGTVTKNPATGPYNEGSSVVLTATPSSGYKFDGWSVDATGTTNPLTVTMNANKSITANFSLIGTTTYTLTINAANGSVTKNPNKVSYDVNESVILTATPSNGYEFTSWSGLLTGTTNPTTIIMNANKNVTATFTSVNTCAKSLDLLNAGSWTTYADDIGSTITPTTPVVTAGTISVSYNIVKDITWASWIDLSVSTPEYVANFADMTSIKITYKSTYDLLISLPTNPLASDNAPYGKSLTASPTSYTTVELTASDFTIPQWYIDEKGQYLGTPLVLDSITYISFGTGDNVDVATQAWTGSININQLTICGIDTSTDLQDNLNNNSNIQSVYFANQTLHILATKTQKYTTEVYSLDGKSIIKDTRTLNTGNNTIGINSSINEGIYFVRIYNDKGVYSQKLLIAK